VLKTHPQPVLPTNQIKDDRSFFTANFFYESAEIGRDKSDKNLISLLESAYLGKGAGLLSARWFDFGSLPYEVIFKPNRSSDVCVFSRGPPALRTALLLG
jgi:hypothetical protein